MIWQVGARRVICMVRQFRVVLAILLVAPALTASVCGQEFDLQPPGEREFISDLAGLLDE